jgi:methylenetetrahydrofolate dehydrogenase (NADP+)/methenyltetrahydrofolate cyclohydrolase
MIIDGKQIANEIQKEIQNTIRTYSTRPPCLAVILVGNNPASLVYIDRKTLACQSVGMESIRLTLPDSITQEELINEIVLLNANENVDGVLVQLPLPLHINPHRITYHISPDKDVDGFHPFNVGKMLIGEKDGFLPCTPLGIRLLLERSLIETKGKHIVVLGRSNIVGKPTAALLMQNTPSGNATVTIAHSYTQNLKELCLSADILVVAIGKPGFLTADMVKEGAVVIDVGTNKVDDPLAKKGYRIVGDVDFKNVAPKCSFITPVPGGVGPMTIAMLMHNTLLSYQRKFHID